MNYSGRISPKRSPRSVTSETVALADELLSGRDLSSIDPTEIPTALHGIQALRHRAIISNERTKIKKCDFLITELNNLLHPPRQTTPKNTPGKRRQNDSPKSSSPNEIEITEDEQNQMNSIIESLLNGCEIDTIDATGIMKLEYVLKARKNQAVEESDYETAKLLDHHLQTLSKFQHMLSPSSVKSTLSIKTLSDREKVLENEIKLRAARRRLEKIKSDLQQEKSRIATEKEEAQSEMFAQIEEEVNLLESEKLDIEMGVGFKASKRLLELRSQEVKLAKRSSFDEATVAKKIADKLEFEERTEFDRKNKALFAKKENAQRKAHEAKIQATEDYWNNIFDKHNQRYQMDIKNAEDEIKGIIKKIEEITGKKYIEPESASELSGSELNFDMGSEEIPTRKGSLNSSSSQSEHPPSSDLESLSIISASPQSSPKNSPKSSPKSSPRSLSSNSPREPPKQKESQKTSPKQSPREPLNDKQNEEREDEIKGIKTSPKLGKRAKSSPKSSKSSKSSKTGNIKRGKSPKVSNE